MAASAAAQFLPATINKWVRFKCQTKLTKKDNCSLSKRYLCQSSYSGSESSTNKNLVVATAGQDAMPPLLSQSMITSTIFSDVGSVSSSNRCERSRSKITIMTSQKKSKQKALIASSPPYCVSSSFSSPSASSMLDGPGGLSTSSDESSVTPKDYIDVPGYLDICCGRGKGFFNRPGNKLFQDMIKDNAESYRKATSKSLKSAIVTSLVKSLTEQGARFLKKDPQANGRWYILSPALAHEKTGHAIRDHWTQRQLVLHQKATGDCLPEEPSCPRKLVLTDEEFSAATGRPRIEPRKKSADKKRVHKKSIKNKVQKPPTRRANKADGKRAKNDVVLIVDCSPPENAEPIVYDVSQEVFVVDSLPKLGMRPFHDVENGSISTICSCPEDHHFESFELFEESQFVGGHHSEAFAQNSNTPEQGDNNLFHVVSTSSNLWSQTHFLPGDDDDAKDDPHMKQNIHASPRLGAMSSLVDANKNDTMMAPHPLVYNDACYFSEHAHSESMRSMMSKDDQSLSDTCFLSWSQYHDFFHSLGSSHFVESNPFMPNPLVMRTPMLQVGFTGNMMNS